MTGYEGWEPEPTWCQAAGLLLELGLVLVVCVLVAAAGLQAWA